MEVQSKHIDYQSLVERISMRYEQGQQQAVLAVNSSMIETYWHIGQYIVEFEQGGKTKADYGKGLLEKLSKDLSLASSLFLRLAASKDKEGILKLAHQGQIVEKPVDLIRDPYVLEFLKIPEPYHLSETELEKRLIDHLQSFLLELGKGFAFISCTCQIGRSYRH